MPNSYLPANDGRFCEWLDRFNTYLNGNAARLGLTVEEVNTLDILHLEWDTAYGANTAAHVAAKAATRTKDDKRALVDALVRGYVSRIQTCPACTNADREAMGITVRGLSTVPSGGALEWCTDTPELTIDINNRLTHNFLIQNKTPDGVKNGRPSGAIGCEIRIAFGEVPPDPEDMTMIGLATKNRYAITFPGDDAGKVANYAMRWINAKGDKGPWSETESATIAA